MSTLNLSMRPVASFTFQNTTEESNKLCLIPGHYDTASVISMATTTSTPAVITSFLSYADPSAIINAGYECDQVADDFNITNNKKDSSGRTYPIKITPKSVKTRYRDFLNFIRLANVKVAKMRITDLTSGDHAIFNSEMEVSRSNVGSKAGSDFIQLSAHINPSNFLQNFIEIDLEQQNLVLDETTLAFLEIPAGANFQIDFTLALQ